MYDTLLALHLLSAAVAFVTVMIFSAWAVGAPATRGSFTLADAAWNVSGAGLVVFGIWLAIYVDGYELWDGWILAALVLFGLTAWFGAVARSQVLDTLGESATPLRITAWHWLRTAAIVAILVLMIWKPGA